MDFISVGVRTRPAWALPESPIPNKASAPDKKALNFVAIEVVFCLTLRVYFPIIIDNKQFYDVF
jgi:hypothetical protein